MNRKLLLASAVVVTSGIILLGAAATNAQTPTPGNTSIVDRITARFKLNKSDVQSVFNEFHNERHTQMQKTMEERLNQAVKDGKITEAQKQLVLTKMNEKFKEREQERTQLQSLTPEERRTHMQQEKQEMKDWAEKNNIDLSILNGSMGHGGMRGWRMK